MTRLPHPPVFPITSPRGARNCPATTHILHQESRARRPRRHWTTWPSHDALWPGPGPHLPRLMDANAVTTEGRMAGAWDRGRCPGRACTATVNNPLPCPGTQAGLQSPTMEPQNLISGTAVREAREPPIRLPSDNSRGPFCLGLLANLLFILFICLFIYMMTSFSLS